MVNIFSCVGLLDSLKYSRFAFDGVSVCNVYIGRDGDLVIG